MKPIYTISLIATAVINVQSDHNVEQQLTQISKWFDGVVNIGENKYGGDCQAEIDSVMDLLCDGFEFCKSDGVCLDKNQYKTELQQVCGLFKEIDYSLNIHPNHHQYAPTYTSLTCEWTIISMDGCTRKETEENKIYYNDEGKITKFYETQIGEVTKDCPEYDIEPEPMPIPSEYHVPEEVEEYAQDPDNNDLNKITELYDAIFDIITYTDGDYNCEDRINHLRDLLADDFSHCYAPDGSCINKDEWATELTDAHCNKYKAVGDYIEITSNSNSYDPSISISVKLVLPTMDDCQETVIYDEVITYNDQGLITKIDVPSEAKVSEICPYKEPEEVDNEYVDEDPEELPPIAKDDAATAEANKPVMIDVLDNDINPNQPELSAKESLVIDGYTQGNKGKVEQKGNKLRYKPNKDECGSDQFMYTIVDNDDGLADSANVYIDIACPTPEYDEEPSEYGDEIRIDTPPIPDYDDESYTRQYQNLQIDVTVGDDPLYGGYTKVTDPEELGYIEADLLKLKHEIIGDKDIESMSLVHAYAKDLSKDSIRYRCLIEYVGPIPPPIQQDDGSYTQTGGALSVGYIQYDVIVNNDDNQYGGCPATQPILGAFESCSFEGTCYYGEETCCGETHSAIFCHCNNGQANCGYTDACFGGCPDEQVPAPEYGSGSTLDAMVNDYQQSTPTELDDGYIEEPAPEPQYEARLAPIANDDSVMVVQNTMTRIYVLANDKDPNHPELSGRDALNIINNTPGNKGKVFISPTGKRLRYIPDDNECGADSFEYTVINDYGLSATAKVYVDIDCNNPQDPYIVEEAQQPEPITYGTEDAGGAPKLIKMNREFKLRSFYKAAFDCRLKQNSGNTELLDAFLGYLCDSAELCVVKDNGVDETCYNKNEIREMMLDRYVDDNESIDYDVEILENDGNKIEAKCTSRRRKTNGCIVIKEEYDSCLFNSDGSIVEFKVLRSNRRIECEQVNNYGDE